MFLFSPFSLSLFEGARDSAEKVVERWKEMVKGCIGTTMPQYFASADSQLDDALPKASPQHVLSPDSVDNAPLSGSGIEADVQDISAAEENIAAAPPVSAVETEPTAATEEPEADPEEQKPAAGVGKAPKARAGRGRGAAGRGSPRGAGRGRGRKKRGGSAGRGRGRPPTISYAELLCQGIETADDLLKEKEGSKPAGTSSAAEGSVPPIRIAIRNGVKVLPVEDRGPEKAKPKRPSVDSTDSEDNKPLSEIRNEVLKGNNEEEEETDVEMKDDDKGQKETEEKTAIVAEEEESGAEKAVADDDDDDEIVVHPKKKSKKRIIDDASEDEERTAEPPAKKTADALPKSDAASAEEEEAKKKKDDEKRGREAEDERKRHKSKEGEKRKDRKDSHGDKGKTKDKDKDRERDKSRHKSGSRDKDRDRDKHRDKDKKSRDRDRDRERERERDKDRRKGTGGEADEKDRRKEQQAERDRATLDKVKPLSAEGMAKIPRRTSATPVSFLDALGSADSDVGEGRRPSIAKTKSRGFRNTGLLDETIKPPGIAGKRTTEVGKKHSSAAAVPDPIDLKKNVKVSPSSLPPSGDRPGGIKLISPKRRKRTSFFRFFCFVFWGARFNAVFRKVCFCGGVW